MQQNSNKQVKKLKNNKHAISTFLQKGQTKSNGRYRVTGHPSANPQKYSPNLQIAAEICQQNYHKFQSSPGGTLNKFRINETSKTCIAKASKVNKIYLILDSR